MNQAERDALITHEPTSKDQMITYAYLCLLACILDPCAWRLNAASYMFNAARIAK